MATKYHVNRNTGDYGVCKASKVACPLGEDSEHYDDLEEAMYQSEVILANNLGLFKKKQKAVLPTINESYSFPQADRLDRLAETIDAINLGSTNSEDLSNSISTVSRQALYYADAAGYLGFVEHNVEKNKKEYYLTESGKSFVDGDAKERDMLVRHAIQENPAVRIYREKGEKAAHKHISELDGANEETVERKLQTVKSWSSKIDSKTNVLNYDDELSERKSGSNNAADKELQGELCTSCFQIKPLTGICPNCDD